MRRERRRTIAEINVVPYVDVMLVLVVILMATAPLMSQGVQVELPQAQAEPLPDDQPLPVIVTVDKDGRFFLSIAQNPSEPLGSEVLQAEVAATLIQEPNRPVLVRGDKRVEYDAVLDAMVLLQRAGVPAVGLETGHYVEKG